MARPRKEKTLKPLIVRISDETKQQLSIESKNLNVSLSETISYKEEAKNIGNEKAYRAVANANGKNNLSIIVPCHRVIANNGKIGGYTGGIWIKEYLLNLEKGEK